MDEREFRQLASLMAVHLPEMAISFLGIVLSFANWRKYPRPALLSFLGFSLVLGSIVAMFGFLVWFLITKPGWNGEFVWLGAFGLRSFLSGIGYVLVIFAIYVGRKPRLPMRSALSHGLHKASDEDCLAAAKDIRRILVELGERLTETMKDREGTG